MYPIRTINQMKYLVQFPAMLICSRVIKADAYAYARIKKDDTNNSDGGFADQDGKELNYENVGSDYRYWRVKGSNAAAVRHTVLTAENFAVGSGNVDKEGYSMITGSIELRMPRKALLLQLRRLLFPRGLWS